MPSTETLPVLGTDFGDYKFQTEASQIKESIGKAGSKVKKTQLCVSLSYCTSDSRYLIGKMDNHCKKSKMKL